MMINMAGRKNKRECVPFFMSVHLADALLLAAATRPNFGNIYLSEFNSLSNDKIPAEFNSKWMSFSYGFLFVF